MQAFHTIQRHFKTWNKFEYCAVVRHWCYGLYCDIWVVEQHQRLEQSAQKALIKTLISVYVTDFHHVQLGSCFLDHTVQ